MLPASTVQIVLNIASQAKKFKYFADTRHATEDVIIEDSVIAYNNRIQVKMTEFLPLPKVNNKNEIDDDPLTSPVELSEGKLSNILTNMVKV